MRYKIKKTDIAPKLGSIKNLKVKSCYLGVSINNTFFYGPHFELLLKWVSSYFDECVILIGDYLNRRNEFIFNNKTEKDAIENSLVLGDELYAKINLIITQLPSQKFKLYRWKQFLDDNPTAMKVKDDLENIYNTNENFKSEILQSCTEYITRLLNKKRTISISKEEAIIQSKEYILEEMAVFSILIEKGFTVQVYPGTQLKVLKDLANGEFPELNTNLKQGIYIDLSVKKV